MKKIFFSLFLMLAASLGTFANSFAGFQTTSSNKMGNQIYTQGLIQNTNNITLIETDATKHQYNINLTNGGTGTFQMGGVTFSYTNSEAGKTAYKTYDYYIQPNGVDREIIIPTESGEQVKIVLMEACAGILVNGVSRDFVEGDNILTATGSSIVLKNSSAKPKISAILSLSGGSTPTPDPSITEEAITVRLDPSSCSSWSTVRLYYWGYEDTDELYGLQWPGIVVNQDINGWYTYTFPATVKKANIIWTNGDGDQTVDITDVTSSTCYALNSTTGTAITISVVDCSSGSSQGETPVSGKYKIGDLYYNLDATNRTAEVTSENGKDPYWSTTITTANIPSTVTYNNVAYSVTSIGDYAFTYCDSLASVSIGNSVTSIGDYAFYYCTGLTSVTIGNSVTSIGSYAFYNCRGLTSVTIPNSVTSIGSSAFYNVPNIVYSGSATGSPWGARSVNGYVDGYLVYSDETKTTLIACSTSAQGEIIIPNSVTSIGSSAFYGCTGLTSVTIPNSVTSIGSRAFYYCTGLTSVHISDVAAWCAISFDNYNANPLYYAHNLHLNDELVTNLVIPNNVTSIGNYAFVDCSGLTSVTIEAGTPPTIGEYCFYYIDNRYIPLNISVYVPCGTLDAYQAAVGWSDYASKIKYAPYPSYAITKIAENGYISTTTTEFTICDEPLVECTANPNRGFYFAHWSDGNTENPRTIELTQDTTMEAIFDYLLTGKCGKDSVLIWTLDKTTMELNITGSGALSDIYTYTYDIESVTIGDEVTSIGSSAFYGFNQLQNVILGSAVKILEHSAFNACSAIETITCYSQRPPTVNESALYGVDYSTIVYVPADYLEIYKMHDAWGLYDVRPLTSPEAIEDIISDKKRSNSIRKILRNGQIYILRGEKVYTLDGQLVR